MYEPGEMVLYGNNGVYRVDEIGPIRHIKGYDPDKQYYKLSSVHRGETTYVPVNTGVFMRPVIARQEAEDLLNRVESIPGEVCTGRDPRLLREHYQGVLETHSCEALVGLIQSVNAKGRYAAKAGKRLGKTDQEFKKRAETLLCEELAVALDLPMDEVRAALSLAIKNVS